MPELIVARRGRLLLAAYLDYLLFGIPWTLWLWTSARLWPDLAGYPGWLRFVLFGVLELLLLGLVRWSPGLFALGIARAPLADPETGARLSVWAVDPAVKAAERWWTMLLGVFAVLDGAKAAVRWALRHPPLPFFGQELPEPVADGLSAAVGAAECAVGLLLLRAWPAAGLASAALYAGVLLSSALSLSQLRAWAAAEVIARRAYQGLPVRAGEVEIMQQAAPLLFVAAPVLLIAWSLLVHGRFRRAGDLSPSR